MRHSKPVRLETAPTGWAKVYLFLDFTIYTCRPARALVTSVSLGYKHVAPLGL